jgi:ribose transport system substrate-binding protein
MKRQAAPAVLAALALAACGQAASSSSTPAGSTAGSPAADKKYSVAISNLGLNFPFPAAISKGMKQKAQELGVTVVTEADAQGKADKQTSDVQDIIAQRPDGVLLLPVDSITSTKWADQLKTASIATVAVASQVGDPKTRKLSDVYPALAALVTQDELDAGKKAGEIALKALPEGGKIAVVEGAAGFAENQLRFDQFLEPARAAGVTFDVVARQPGDWVPDKAQAACQNMLQANPDVRLFYALSDDMAVGCAKAIKAAKSKALAVGIGGSKLGVDAIKSGEIYGTVCYKPEDMGQLAMQTLHDRLTGKQTASAQFVTYETPAITKDNVADCNPQW